MLHEVNIIATELADVLPADPQLRRQFCWALFARLLQDVSPSRAYPANWPEFFTTLPKTMLSRAEAEMVAQELMISICIGHPAWAIRIFAEDVRDELIAAVNAIDPEWQQIKGKSKRPIPRQQPAASSIEALDALEQAMEQL